MALGNTEKSLTAKQSQSSMTQGSGLLDLTLIEGCKIELCLHNG